MKRVGLITRVAGGIGQATAQLFASEGWYVFGIDRQPEQELAGVDRTKYSY
ncbi:MAG: hypothetical protein AB4368_29215 [Xenococcaceae cyanobacterium]